VHQHPSFPFSRNVQIFGNAVTKVVSAAFKGIFPPTVVKILNTIHYVPKGNCFLLQAETTNPKTQLT
jgi:hypothetical protein